jgi:predicted site-specific integrase-resolvase
MVNMAPKKYYTQQEAAKLAGVSIRTLYRWRKLGVGPTYQQYMRNGVVRYPCAEFLEFLQEHTNK